MRDRNMIRLPDVIDDSEAARLVKLLGDNGFDIASMECRGFNGTLDSIDLRVYPRQTEATKDERTQGS